MPKTTAQRQAAYRQKHLHEIEGRKARINLLVEHPAKMALSRLAIRYGVTKSGLLERLILEEQDRALRNMGAEETTAYYESVTA